MAGYADDYPFCNITPKIYNELKRKIRHQMYLALDYDLTLQGMLGK